MKRFISSFIIIAVLVMVINTRAFATDADPNMFYDGPIDMFTGEPLEEGEDSMPSRVSVSDGSIYDRTNEMFVYYLEEGTVMVSVADGMIVTGEVGFALSETAKAVLYKDGEAYDSIPASVNVPGSYTLVDKEGSSEGQIMSFRIINELSGAIDQYTMPAGFSVTSVYINGNDETEDYGRVDMTKEGDYQISYICSDNGITYNLNVTIDHTAPQVKFEGLDDDNRARGPVVITGLEDGDTITVYRDGEELGLLASKTELNQSGDYRVIVRDIAGNTVDREFRILIYLDIKAWMFVGFVLLLVVGAAIVLTVTRKNLRVR